MKIKDLLTDNIRDIEGDDTELFESMKKFGWHKEFPALLDENHVVLVGHRRLKVAKQLGIEPVIETLTIGDGEEADVERLKLAIISNVGSKPMTKNDRQKLAEHLYGTKQWTMAKFAEALNVTHKTISKDLEGFVPEVQTLRPKGGRPKVAKPEPTLKPKSKSKPEPASFWGVQHPAVLQRLWDAAPHKVKQEFARANAMEIAELAAQEVTEKDSVARIADRADQRSEQQKAREGGSDGIQQQD